MVRILKIQRLHKARAANTGAFYPAFATAAKPLIPECERFHSHCDLFNGANVLTETLLVCLENGSGSLTQGGSTNTQVAVGARPWAVKRNSVAVVSREDGTVSIQQWVPENSTNVLNKCCVSRGRCVVGYANVGQAREHLIQRDCNYWLKEQSSPKVSVVTTVCYSVNPLCCEAPAKREDRNSLPETGQEPERHAVLFSGSVG
jgi:hypothetical protein